MENICAAKKIPWLLGLRLHKVEIEYEQQWKTIIVMDIWRIRPSIYAYTCSWRRWSEANLIPRRSHGEGVGASRGDGRAPDARGLGANRPSLPSSMCGTHRRTMPLRLPQFQSSPPPTDLGQASARDSRWKKDEYAIYNPLYFLCLRRVIAIQLAQGSFIYCAETARAWKNSSSQQVLR
jgi:hypothetical protein